MQTLNKYSRAINEDFVFFQLSGILIIEKQFNAILHSVFIFTIYLLSSLSTP